MAAAQNEILRSRLFGYAVLFRARPVEGGFEGVTSRPEDEAADLARELQLHAGQGVAPDSARPTVNEVGLSVPFGRCGIGGRPLEHVRIHHAQEAWLDILRADGSESRAVEEGETVLVEPGAFVRFRGTPRPGGRVLIAFQTEDRSPLSGHAAPLSAVGETVPTDAVARLNHTTATFESLRQDQTAARQRLADVFEDMRKVVENSPEVAVAQQNADAAGSYAAGPDGELFDAARQMLTPGIIDRIGAGDAQIFRFPGMFGAVAPLFPLLEA